MFLGFFFRESSVAKQPNRHLQLTFFSNHLLVCPYHRRGFTASASYNKTITSPNYPSRPESDLNCNWLLEVDSSLGSDDYIVKVMFSDFGVECDDAVRFYDGNNMTVSNLLRSYCGTTHPEVIYSIGRYLFVNFYTDNDYSTFRGFSFSFSAVKKGIILSVMDNTPPWFLRYLPQLSRRASAVSN